MTTVRFLIGLACGPQLDTRQFLLADPCIYLVVYTLNETVESYWLFKKILLGLAISSICQINKIKVRKLFICNFISQLLQGDKYLMGFCLTVWKLTLIVLFWKNSYTAGSFKIESALFLSSGQRRSYEKCSYNEIGVTTFDSWQLEIKKQKLFEITRVQVIEYEFL